MIPTPFDDFTFYIISFVIYKTK